MHPLYGCPPHPLSPHRLFSLEHCHPYYHPAECWKVVGVLTAVPLPLPNKPAISLLVMYSREMKHISIQNAYANVQSNMIYENPKV